VNLGTYGFLRLHSQDRLQILPSSVIFQPFREGDEFENTDHRADLRLISSRQSGSETIDDLVFHSLSSACRCDIRTFAGDSDRCHD
jgi:hypothetical protein